VPAGEGSRGDNRNDGHKRSGRKIPMRGSERAISAQAGRACGARRHLVQAERSHSPIHDEDEAADAGREDETRGGAAKRKGQRGSHGRTLREVASDSGGGKDGTGLSRLSGHASDRAETGGVSSVP
jgi:hypothetical protein